MILVDTSVWIDYFREGLPRLVRLLEQNFVLTHPFVLGELACGNLTSRTETLRLLSNLPVAPRASDSEVLAFIEANRLMGRGIGFIDAHLLASTALAADTRLWTHDKRLAKVSKNLDFGYESSVN
ncbi:type II toxin-antitoxin system VapC family toxin [Billgrantia endophytica]|uniref:VapC toxin family PIN domain ribonuclease n=1 Tax=Billgrantia endophytica TaxID=2033802 RepID=A0A2N7U3A3_9GAMM|nr:type II toxin-antitoxin system VapC family toxin [Halomonas endophytica]PMR74922.1 VapC toxin family PIN domain ribonuclease [Halomonas endophytica]